MKPLTYLHAKEVFTALTLSPDQALAAFDLHADNLDCLQQGVDNPLPATAQHACMELLHIAEILISLYARNRDIKTWMTRSQPEDFNGQTPAQILAVPGGRMRVMTAVREMAGLQP